MAKVAVCLSGCGVYDGTEIHEAVCTLLALTENGAEVICTAPSVAQAGVIDHLKGEAAEGEQRCVLTESARIARGEITRLEEIKAKDIDALIFPGGFGAAKNLCTFASEGPECSVEPEVERLVGEMLEAGKPVGAMCIAPALIARIAGKRGLSPRLTIGNDAATAAGIEATGCKHVTCTPDQIVVDEENGIVTTPAYMLGTSPAEIMPGIRKLVEAVLARV